MNKKFYLSFLLLFLLCSSVFAFGSQEKTNTVVVYAYDSFTADWGPGPELKKKFESATGYKLEFVTFEDATSVLTQAISEGKSCKADVLVGVDNFHFQKAKQADIFKAYKPNNISNVKQEVIFDTEFLTVPYDYGYFTLMYDTESKIPAPKSLSQLADKKFQRSVIIMDPRTSTPGTGFLIWSKQAFPNSFEGFWKGLKSSLLTMSPDWSTGYGLFTSGEAPFALSYTSSEAYHVAYDDTSRYKALIFDEGHIMQIEAMGIAKYTKNEAGAKAFIEFMLTDEAQAVLPETQWMYPVSSKVTLPDSYKNIAVPKKVLPVSITFDYDSLIDSVINIVK